LYRVFCLSSNTLLLLPEYLVYFYVPTVDKFLDVVQLHKLYSVKIKEGILNYPLGEVSWLREDWNLDYDEAGRVSFNERDARLKLGAIDLHISTMEVELITSFPAHLERTPGKQYAETRRPRDVLYGDEYYDRKEDDGDFGDGDGSGDGSDEDGDSDDDDGDSDDDDGDSDDDDG
jgi:hypothetical protein